MGVKVIQRTASTVKKRTKKIYYNIRAIDWRKTARGKEFWNFLINSLVTNQTCSLRKCLKENCDFNLNKYDHKPSTRKVCSTFYLQTSFGNCFPRGVESKGQDCSGCRFRLNISWLFCLKVKQKFWRFNFRKK